MGKHTEKKSNKKKRFLNILIVIFIIALIISIVYIAKWFMDNKENEKIADKVSEAIIESNENEEEKHTATAVGRFAHSRRGCRNEFLCRHVDEHHYRF